MNGCLLGMTKHGEVFARYCRGRKQSDHAVVMCGRQYTSSQLPKELKSVIVIHRSTTRHGI